MTDTKHLWEIDHPYYCEECNYFSASADTHQTFESWSDFLEEWGDQDDDLNLLFRWDWNRPDPADYTYEAEEDPDFEIPSDTLQLYYMMQRKARNLSVYVGITEADEPAVREFLKPKAEAMRKLWDPFLPDEGVL